MIKLAEEFEKILGADNGNPPDSLRQMYPKINRNFDRVKDWFNSLLGLINGHIQSNTAHAAEHITYTGDAPGNNAKQAINNTYNRISEIVAQAGDDNTEIVDARGGYTVLGDRLNATDAQLAEIVQDDNLTVNIPTDYTTLQEAINELSKKHVKQGVLITLLIETGHRLTAGLSLSKGDYSHFKISSEDTTVLLATDFMYLPTLEAPGSNKVAFVFHRCAAPQFDIFVDMGNVVDSNGISLTGGSVLNVTPGKGVKNAGANNIMVSTGSTLYGVSTIWTGAGVNGVWVTTSSVASIGASDCSNCGDLGLFCSRASQANFADGIAQNCTTAGVRSSSASNVMAQSANCSGSGTGMIATYAGTIAAQDSVCDNCTSVGLSASEGGRIGARAASAKNALSDGISAFNGGHIDFINGDASGAVNRDITIYAGGIIYCTGAIGNPAYPTNILTERGIIFKNA